LKSLYLTDKSVYDSERRKAAVEAEAARLLKKFTKAELRRILAKLKGKL
jgi:hypothetical protein